MIFNFFVLSFLVFISCGFAAEAAAPNTTELKAEDSVNVRSFIAHEISAFLKRLGEGTFDFTDEERDVAYYNKGVAEEKEEIKNLFTLRIEAGKLFQDGNYLESLKKNIKLFYKTRGQTYLCSIIDIVRNAGLFNEASDLYVLYGLMFNRLPIVETEGLLIGGASTLADPTIFNSHSQQKPKLIHDIWQGVAPYHFATSPFLQLKVCRFFHGLPDSTFVLGELISLGVLNEDLDGHLITSVPQRKEAAASYFRLSKTPNALSALGVMILKGETDLDEKGKKIEANKRYKVAASLFRRTKTPSAGSLLARLILDNKINIDENRQGIPTLALRYWVAARLARRDQSELGVITLAELLVNNQTFYDEADEILTSENQRHTAVARILLRCNTSESNLRYANYLIHFIRTDENGTSLNTSEKILGKILEITNTLDSENYSKKGMLHLIRGAAYLVHGAASQENKKKALEELYTALQNGEKQALYHYEKLKKEMEHLEASVSMTLSDISTEQESIEEESDSDYDDSDIHLDVESSTPASSESLSTFRQKQAESTAAWKQIIEQRKAAWREKIELFSTSHIRMNVEILEKTPIAERWAKLAINGRLRLAELWDQRVSNLVDAIKAGDTRLGAPEMLDGDYDGWMSRRISQKLRLIYNFTNGMLVVKECGQHYRGR